ncbi:MAG TPA: hypothetical protein VFH83_10390, partial [Spirochaetia bacterium]|nr:hypothetical protein [Spirochaetia bacterium]
QGRIQEALKRPEPEMKPALAELVSSLLLEDGQIKIALSSRNQRALHSSLFAPSPPAGLEPAT